MLGLRVTTSDIARLDALVAKTGDALARSSLARAAMRLGLEILESEPARLFSHKAKG